MNYDVIKLHLITGQRIASNFHLAVLNEKNFVYLFYSR